MFEVLKRGKVHNLSIQCQLDLFDKIIKPILLYGCEVSDKNECAGAQYRCENGQCIHLTFYCDGTVHCDDSSDEDKCGKIYSPL
jgi:hypothetical protein